MWETFSLLKKCQNQFWQPPPQLFHLKNENQFEQGVLSPFGQCPRDRVFFSGKSSLSQTECLHKGLLSSWPQIRRIVGANHRGRGASDWCEIYSDANWRQNRCHQKIAITTNSNNIAPGRSLDIARVKNNLLKIFRFSFFCSSAFWIYGCRITSARGCSRNTSTCSCCHGYLIFVVFGTYTTALSRQVKGTPKSAFRHDKLDKIGQK